jgi:hypothetical protein
MPVLIIVLIRVPPHAWRNCSIHLLIAIQSGLCKVIICYKFWDASRYNCCLVPRIIAKLKIGGFWLWYQVPIHYLLLYCISIGYWIIVLSLQHPIPEACFLNLNCWRFQVMYCSWIYWMKQKISYICITYTITAWCMIERGYSHLVITG